MSTGKRKTTEEKVAILKEAETLGAVETIRKHGISYQTYYTWKARHASGGADSLQTNGIVATTELKRLQKENALLKELVADKELHIKIQNELLKKSSFPGRKNAGSQPVHQPGIC